MQKIEFIKKELEELHNKSLFRTLKTVEGEQGKYLRINGEEYLSFCSNNYLDLANHPDVIKAVVKAMSAYGWGTGASRLVSGNMTLHKELEVKIAQFKGVEDAVVFPTGYMANIGTISSLVGKGDLVISDKLNHASIIDGCRLSRATFRVYPHCDMERLERILAKAKDFRRTMIVTETVFSMDGDLAPLNDVIRLAEKYKAMTMVDEAHATGVFGINGRGVLEHCGLEGKVDVVMGTLSKAVGSIGGFVCGDYNLINFLRNKAGSFIYTTALPPAVCAASIAGLKIIKEKPELSESLWRNINYIKNRLSDKKINIGDSQSPIIPIIIGDAEKTAKLSKALLDSRILIPAIRPPTVPKGSSRLRVTIMSSHSVNDLDRLADILFDLLYI
ncbi:MAG: 8-amino-7-oxononanoate synthase [Candidatus Anammoxibacter sp.]